MPKYAHRVAFNADLFMTVETDSPDSGTQDLERLCIAKIRAATLDHVSDFADVAIRYDSDIVFYPRQAGLGECPVDAAVELENFTIEHVEEISTQNDPAGD